MKITDAPCQCGNCGWRGMVYDCEPDVDGDGSLGCPRCGANITVISAPLTLLPAATDPRASIARGKSADCGSGLTTARAVPGVTMGRIIDEEMKMTPRERAQLIWNALSQQEQDERSTIEFLTACIHAHETEIAIAAKVRCVTLEYKLMETLAAFRMVFEIISRLYGERDDDEDSDRLNKCFSTLDVISQWAIANRTEAR